MRRVVAIAVVALASIAAASPAQALTLARADLEGTNGYAVRIDGIAGFVTVSAKDDGAGARYTAKASVGRARIEADLGAFGAMDLEFEPNGHSECRGGFKVRHGEWFGAVRFVAETGFTSVAATAAPGKTMRLARSCFRRGRGGDEPELVLLTAAHRTSSQATFVGISRIPGRRTSIYANRSRREHGIEISDFATDRLGHQRVRLNPARKRAKVRPKGPFSGEAIARGRRWRGDLVATMPATGTIPLAGPNFRARFESLQL